MVSADEEKDRKDEAGNAEAPGNGETAASNGLEPAASGGRDSSGSGRQSAENSGRHASEDSGNRAVPKKRIDAETAAENGSPARPAAHAGAGQNPHLDDMYREVVLDHYKHPRGRHTLQHPNVAIEGFNPTCGDQVHVALEVEGDRVSDCQVDCQGCSISVASGSMMAELIKGKNRKELEQLTESFKAMMHGRDPKPGLDMGDLEALEGVKQFPVRIKCALLAWTTLQEALTALDRERPGAED